MRPPKGILMAGISTNWAVSINGDLYQTKVVIGTKRKRLKACVEAIRRRAAVNEARDAKHDESIDEAFRNDLIAPIKTFLTKQISRGIEIYSPPKLMTHLKAEEAKDATWFACHDGKTQTEGAACQASLLPKERPDSRNGNAIKAVNASAGDDAKQTPPAQKPVALAPHM